MATKIVGLDLGTHTVKVCELVTTFRNFELVGFGSEAVGAAPDAEPAFEEIAAAAKRLLERRGLLGETMMCALPPHLVSTTLLELPFDQPKKIKAVLPFQLDEAVPFDVEDLVYDYQIVGRKPEGGCAVLVAYVKRETMGAFLAALAAEGIDPKVVGIGAVSYFNVYDHVFGEGNKAPLAVLDLGHCNSDLVIFDGGEPRLARDVPSGGRHITAALAEAFNVDADQAERGKIAEGSIAARASRDTQVDYNPEGESRRDLISRVCEQALRPVVREVRRSLVAHEVETGRPVEKLFLTGGTSQLRGLAPYLEQALGVPVALLEPLKLPFNRLGDGDERLRPYVTKPLALSLRAFHRAHQSLIDFRQDDFAYTGDFGFLRGRIISLAVSAVLIIVLGALVAISKKRVLEAEYQTLANEVKVLSQVMLGYETDSADALFAAMAQNTGGQSSLPEVGAFDVLAELSEKIEYDLKVDFDRFEFDTERKRLTLHGKTVSGGDVERLVDIIEATRCFKSVNKERVEKSVDDKTKFRLSSSFTCS